MLRKRYARSSFVRAGPCCCFRVNVHKSFTRKFSSRYSLFYATVTVFPSSSNNFACEGCLSAWKLRGNSMENLCNRHCSHKINFDFKTSLFCCTHDRVQDASLFSFEFNQIPFFFWLAWFHQLSFFYSICNYFRCIRSLVWLSWESHSWSLK